MLKYIILGMVQGLTEFLPVSSSAHLVIMQKLLNMQGQELAVSVILHLGTVLSLLVFFFKDILKLFGNLRMLFLVAVVTVITGIIGLSGKDFFEGLFSALKPVAMALIVTGIILILAKRFMQAKRSQLNIKDALILGVTQGIAIIPGISRSGITVSTLLFRKIDRETAFRFSFLASIPAIFGATLLEAKKVCFVLQSNSVNLFAGFMASFLFGLVSLWILKRAIKKAKLHYFGYYCILVALISLIFIK